MKKFFKDLAEYQKEANKLTKVWYKKHWKGTIVLCIIISVIPLLLYYLVEICENFKELFSKKEDIQDEELA